MELAPVLCKLGKIKLFVSNKIQKIAKYTKIVIFSRVCNFYRKIINIHIHSIKIRNTTENKVIHEVIHIVHKSFPLFQCE